jgi:hypothetical protein
MNAVDTNVLIYSCDSRDPARQAVALDVIKNLHSHRSRDRRSVFFVRMSLGICRAETTRHRTLA